MSKKLLALLLALVMIVGSFTSVLADTKEPVKEDKKTVEPAKPEEKKDEKSEEKKEEKKEEVKDEYLAKAIDVLKKAGFISGYSKDSEDFKAEKNVTRAEFASMIVRVKGLEDSAKALANLPTGFKDVPSNLWANGYIAVAKQQGFVNGYPNGTFQPNRQISYQDMATMLTIALGQAEAGTVYPAGYIVKAQQLGLFNKVDVPAYTDMATRGNVFKMVYNMITSKEFAQRKILKAIVLENPRVENLAENQITVEVINVVQKADWVEANRDKRGDQHTYTLEKDAKFDAEGLLGRVVNVTVDKNDKVVDITVDDSYEYLEGTITYVSPKKFELNESTYSVLFDERYASEDERVYRTYLNDADKKYEDFAKDYKDGAYDYARITVKNGKVIFIDAYHFDDVAPVAEVKDGKVWYYDDARNARIVKTDNDFPWALTFVNKGIFSVGDVKAIAKDDVIHFYNNYKKAIVRKDAKVEAELTKTSEDKIRRQFVHTKQDKEVKNQLRMADKFRAVYSYEGKEFNTLTSRFMLEPVTGEKVKVLVALDGTVQLVEGNIAWNDGVNGIRKISSRGEVKLIPSKGEEFWAVEGRNTSYYNWKKRGDNNKQLDRFFNINDIVYYIGEADKDSKDQTIGRMLNIAEYKDYMAKMNYASIDARYIQIGKEKYRYFDNLHAYYIDKYNRLQAIDNIEHFIAENAKNNDLEAFLMTEPELKKLYGDLRIDYFNFLTDAKNVASIVVFKNAKYRANTDVIYAEVDTKFNYVSTVRFIDADRVVYDVDLTDEGMDPADFKQKDIVELHILKDTAAKDRKVGFVEKVVIDANAEKQFIKDLPRNAYMIGKETKYFDGKTVIFNRQLGDYVQVYYDEDDTNYVRVIRYFKDGNQKAKEDINILASKSDDPLQFELEDMSKKNNVVYKVNDRTWFVGEDGKDFGYGADGLKAFYNAYKGSQVKVEYDVRTEYNGKLALKVVLVKTANEIKAEKAEALLKAAKKEIEAIKAMKFASTDFEGKVFEDAIDAILANPKYAGIEAYTEYESEIDANGVEQIKAETELTHPDTAKKEVAVNRFSQNTTTAQDKADKAAKAAKAERLLNRIANDTTNLVGKKIILGQTYTEDVAKAVLTSKINDLSYAKDMGVKVTKVGQTAEQIKANKNEYTVTIGHADTTKTETFVVVLK